MKLKTYEVIFRTWNTRTYTVVADDADDAVDEAESQLTIDLAEGEDYEVSDIFELDGSDDYVDKDR